MERVGGGGDPETEARMCVRGCARARYALSYEIVCWETAPLLLSFFHIFYEEHTILVDYMLLLFLPSFKLHSRCRTHALPNRFMPVQLHRQFISKLDGEIDCDCGIPNDMVRLYNHGW